MDEDEYINKMNKIEQTLAELTEEKTKIVSKINILETEKRELEDAYNLKKIRTTKNAKKWLSQEFAWSQKVLKALREKFNFNNFRQKQLAAINGTMAKKNVILLMPTGGGKSLVYQLTAYVSKGITLVVSPLISLIEDQLRSLNKIGIEAEAINGHTVKEEKRRIYLEMIKPNSRLKLLYVTPEWVTKSKQFMNQLQKCYDKKLLARIVIDEVHCCSTWGHDFRPDYNNLGSFRKMFANVPIIGLTATATMKILIDIQKMLNLEDALVITAPFNRPNLYYKVIHKPIDKNSCIKMLADLILKKYKNKCGIIYAATVRETQELYIKLKDYGIRVKFYHAQMDAESRKTVYDKWMNNIYHVIVATIAFGMGIDKPDVRFVIHYTVPKSMEAFYQESGRAGRDGQVADCIIMYNMHDYMKSYANASNVVDETNSKAVLQYCLEQSRCRRALIAEHFEDTWRRTDCAKMCDRCYDEETIRVYDVIQALFAINEIIDFAATQEIKVTLIKLMNAWYHSGSREIRPPNIKRPKCPKPVSEHIVGYLIHKGYLSIGKGYSLLTTIAYVYKGTTISDETPKILMDYRSKIDFPVEEIKQKESEIIEISSVSSSTDMDEEPSPKKRKTNE